MDQARVPKFGNWEKADDVGYTQCFDNVRTKRNPGKTINPNDPAQNPEAFLVNEPQVRAEPGARKPKDMRKPEADPHLKHRGLQSRGNKVSGRARSQGHGNDAKTPERSGGRRSGRDKPEQEFVVPPFGKWDETNPASGDKYTGIFKKLREDRQSPMFEPSYPTGRDYDRSPQAKRFSCFGWCAK